MKNILKLTWLDRYESYRPFEEYEIWFLFRWAAYGEAFGWALLLYGLGAQHFPGWFAHSWALAIGGSIHGMIFIAYLLLVLAGYSSLGWSRLKTFVAILVSITPGGTLVFEQWAARQRTVWLAAAGKKSRKQ